MTGCEVWLCRVLLHPGPRRARMMVSQLDAFAHKAVLAKVVSGELGVLPDGCIVEPVSSHRTEPEAAAAREQAMHDKPEDDWRVVITLPVSK